jgi:hypothetical protein
MRIERVSLSPLPFRASIAATPRATVTLRNKRFRVKEPAIRSRMVCCGKLPPLGWRRVGERKSLRARLPFLLTVCLARPHLALTAGTRLLISAAKEGKDASPFNDFGKSPEEKPPPGRYGALAAVRLL